MRIKRIDYSKSFIKNLRKSPLKIRKAFQERLRIFIDDKFHPFLNNHALMGEYQGYRSINVTGDWRAIFQEFEGGELIYFDILDTHSNLYKKSN